jgi:hypothetical protein
LKDTETRHRTASSPTPARTFMAARSSWRAAIGCLLASACIQVVQTAPPQEPEPRTPEPFVSMEEPKLVPTEVPGLFAVPSLDATVYYYKPEELWYRYAYRSWYQAFRWDGAWFIPGKLPDVVKARVPQETPKTIKEQVKSLDQKLEELDKADRLKELEKKMKELDEQDAAKSGAPPKAEPPAGSGKPK